MHDEILNVAQQKLLPLMAQFKREYYLVGGTAIALHIGHRRSVDFDMFKPTAINHKRNLDRIVASGFKYQVTRRVFEQMKWKNYVDLYFLLTRFFKLHEIADQAIQPKILTSHTPHPVISHAEAQRARSFRGYLV